MSREQTDRMRRIDNKLRETVKDIKRLETERDDLMYILAEVAQKGEKT